MRSLLLSNLSSWHHTASATQLMESCGTFGDSGTPGCSASDVAGLRHMRLPGSGLHHLHRKGRPTGGRPPVKTAPDHCSRWAFRSFSCCWCRCRSRHRQERQRQPWAPDTQDRDPAVPAVPAVKSWQVDVPRLQQCAWESFESKAATKDDNLMGSSFSPGSCTAIKELICIPAVGRHAVHIWSILKFNPWRPEPPS